MTSNGIVSREPNIVCKNFSVNNDKVSLDGELMGYIQKLTMSSDRRDIVVDRLLPKINSEGFESITQSIIVVENK